MCHNILKKKKILLILVTLIPANKLLPLVKIGDGISVHYRPSVFQ